MHTLSLSEFRAHASEMLDLVEQGETVRILRHGKPVAELVPFRPQAQEELPRWKRPIEPVKYLRPPAPGPLGTLLQEREGGW